MSQPADGTVVSVLRYPIKSMMGEEVNRSQVTASGLMIANVRSSATNDSSRNLN